MAQSANEIKQRVRGIGSIMQITKAMELVSTSKMRKSREQLEKARPYYLTILKSITDVLNNSNVNHPLLEKREVKNSLYIVMTGDRGLAGGYNNNVCRLVDDKYRDNKKNIHIIPVGLKGYEFFNNRKYNIIDKYLGISEEPSFANANIIGEKAIELYLSEEIDEINLVYTRFKTTLSYEPEIIRILPTSKIKESEDIDLDKTRDILEFEPSPEVALDYLIPKYIESTIYGALIEASASEQASRRTAMSSATENAEEMIDELNMTYNRVRQAAITMEISEIVSGADALN